MFIHSSVRHSQFTHKYNAVSCQIYRFDWLRAGRKVSKTGPFRRFRWNFSHFLFASCFFIASCWFSVPMPTETVWRRQVEHLVLHEMNATCIDCSDRIKIDSISVVCLCEQFFIYATCEWIGGLFLAHEFFFYFKKKIVQCLIRIIFEYSKYRKFIEFDQEKNWMHQKR